MPLNGIPPLAALQAETFWIDAARYQDAERQYYEMLAQGRLRNQAVRKNSKNSSDGNQVQEKATPTSSLASEIAHARQKIQNILKSGEFESDNLNLLKRVETLEAEKKQMQQKISELSSKLALLETKVDDCLQLRHKQNSESKSNQHKSESTKAKPSVNGPAADEDDDIDLFGSEEETEEELRVKEERVKAYENKKSKKPALVAKSSVVLDVKPWSDETDMKELEIAVRKIQMDGLTWGASKLVPLAYGIKKLQIIATVVDDKVSVDGLQESIEEIEDLVQSVDIAAFNKL
ncbi:probable elongation factor 1-delta isoform X1 [Argiope bruennichi]|uniref:Elongation factor 1-delta like protein n=1 Tax=Argiope bruennichi TaxID=94029 RepID=A0A8T0FFJ8_ARGBR|nr:probable elongation factor 1-delta isoform X1 [Argiope bruennichi]KAF8790077.1 Elongation factor 1-delta like protein [Argiope bruennichi]